MLTTVIAGRGWLGSTCESGCVWEELIVEEPNMWANEEAMNGEARI